MEQTTPKNSKSLKICLSSPEDKNLFVIARRFHPSTVSCSRAAPSPAPELFTFDCVAGVNGNFQLDW